MIDIRALFQRGDPLKSLLTASNYAARSANSAACCKTCAHTMLGLHAHRTQTKGAVRSPFSRPPDRVYGSYPSADVIFTAPQCARSDAIDVLTLAATAGLS
jgi:hypothetical protein